MTRSTHGSRPVRARRPRGARPVDDAIAAVVDGKIAVERLVMEALRAKRFSSWLRKELDRTRRDEPRRATFREPAPFPDDVATSALARARARFAGAGIEAVAWGTIRRRGRALDQVGLIVIIDDERALVQRELPRTFPIQARGERFRIPVGVQRLSQGGRESGTARPGDRAQVHVSGRRGTIGAVVADGDRVAVVVSGHVAGPDRVPSTAQLSSGQVISLGTVEAHRDDADVDGARIDGLSSADAPLVSSPPVAVRELVPSDVRILVTVRRAQGDGDKDANIEAIDEPAVFEDRNGVRQRMNSLIKLSRKVTRRGDSGAPVVDTAGALIGFVVGSANGHTYVIPARRVFDAIL